MSLLDNITIPEFKEFIQKPNYDLCIQIDANRLMVEMLGGLEISSSEFSTSTYSSKLLLDGKYALVIRYKREKDGNYRPACTLSFDEDIELIHLIRNID